VTHPYGRDLAYVHDVGYGDVAEAAARAVVKRLSQPAFIVDLGCGSGTFARAMTERGHRVLGIDLSPSMIERARRNAPQARFRVGSFVDVALPACDVVTAIGEVFNYLFDERARRLTFGRVAAALRPGGLFVLDLAGPGRVTSPSGHTLGRDFAVLVDREEKNGVLERRITTFRKVGAYYRRSDELHRQRLFSPSEVLSALRAAGFRARPARGYDTLRFPRGLTAFFATKR